MASIDNYVVTADRKRLTISDLTKFGLALTGFVTGIISLSLSIVTYHNQQILNRPILAISNKAYIEEKNTTGQDRDTVLVGIPFKNIGKATATITSAEVVTIHLDSPAHDMRCEAIVPRPYRPLPLSYESAYPDVEKNFRVLVAIPKQCPPPTVRYTITVSVSYNDDISGRAFKQEPLFIPVDVDRI